MLKRCRMVFSFAHGGGKSVTVVVCYDIRAKRALLSGYGCSKFATQHVDFWVPDKIARNYVEMASHDAVLCSLGKDNCDSHIVL